LTPQAFSYATVGANGMIYIPPYGLTESLDDMLKIDPVTYNITKIKLDVDKSTEKWQKGVVYRNLIYFLPYNESKILVVDTETDEIEYIAVSILGRGKYIQGHIHGNEIVALPYGEHEPFSWAMHINLNDHSLTHIHIDVPFEDCKKWHTTQIIDGIIYGVPRGEAWEHEMFHCRIHYDCNAKQYELIDMRNHWLPIANKTYTNKKFTTLAKVGRKLYAPPYSENPEFDLLLRFDGTQWFSEHTGLTATSRMYYTHTVARNGKIYFPPAGHEEDWSEMLIVNSNTDTWYTKDLGIGKESKKYFAGVENSQGKIYYIPRGGCVCEPVETWKSQGDLAEILVVDTTDDSHYTIDVSEYFKDSTTIEKYNNCVIVNDVIFALPYGESDAFQTVLIFDTLQEQVVRTMDLGIL
jgi:hypothetical protein